MIGCYLLYVIGKIKYEVKDVLDEDIISLDKFYGWSFFFVVVDVINIIGYYLLFSGDDIRKYFCVFVFGNLMVFLVFFF